MSTSPPEPSRAPAPSTFISPPPPTVRNEITIISHSGLFYWWPVWAVGFLLTILTLVDNHRMAIVPAKSRYLENVEVTEAKAKEKTTRTRNVIELPEGASITPSELREEADNREQLKLHITNKQSYGVLFVTVLIVVILITNVPLRGMWSIMVIVVAVLIVIILALWGVWADIVRTLSYLDIRINMGGYFLIACILFAIWLVSVLLFDRQVYMVFTPGQLRVCTAIGGGEHVYDTTGLRLEKQRSDLFRHWVLGLGSGDLIVRTPTGDHFNQVNVLFIGRKVRLVEDMLQKKKVVESR
jgi:hypothetical protein